MLSRRPSTLDEMAQHYGVVQAKEWYGNEFLGLLKVCGLVAVNWFSVRFDSYPITCWLVLAHPYLRMGVFAHGHCAADCGGGTPNHLSIVAAHLSRRATIA